MPSTYAHFVFGKKVFKTLPEQSRELIRRHKALYLIGLHGPDILFYYKALSSNPVNDLGYRMHGEPAADFFGRALSLVRQGERKFLRESQLSYLLGFVCHFVLDSRCHGYIENKIRLSGISHSEIESEFDRMLMVRQGLDPLRHGMTAHIRPSAGNARVIAPFFRNVTAGQTEQALRSMIRYHQLLLAPGRIKRGMICAVLKLSGNYESMHGLLINRNTNPDCVDSSLRLTKLMEQAVKAGRELCGNFLECAEGKNTLDPYFNRTFDAERGWEKIPVLPVGEEQSYEVSGAGAGAGEHFGFSEPEKECVSGSFAGGSRRMRASGLCLFLALVSAAVCNHQDHLLSEPGDLRFHAAGCHHKGEDGRAFRPGLCLGVYRKLPSFSAEPAAGAVL